MNYLEKNTGIYNAGLKRIAKELGIPARKKALKKRAMYELKLTDEEMRSLGYIADRYNYAAILYDALMQESERGTGSETYSISESDLWEFNDAIDEEDGYMPLMGGSLIEKIHKLLQDM